MQPRILTQIPLRLLEPVRKAHPDLEIQEIPTQGPLDASVEGEILLTFLGGLANLSEVLARGIRWVHLYGTGVDGFPFELLGERTMTCSRGASAEAISEWVLAVLLAAEKKLPEAWIDAPPERWNVARLGTLRDKKLALVGFGAIGQAIARRALPFGMRVEAVRRTNAASPIEGVRTVTSLEEAIAGADHVVVAAPETPATHQLINDDVFGYMKPGVHFVNVARGGLVDQDALRRSLDADHVGLATLDCVTPEPLPVEHWLYAHPRVRLSAHISWSSPHANANMIDAFVENVGRYRRGEALTSRVDPIAGY